MGPTDAEYFYEGRFYKLGRFGFVYRWNGEEWRKSTKRLHSVSNGKSVMFGKIQ